MIFCHFSYFSIKVCCVKILVKMSWNFGSIVFYVVSMKYNPVLSTFGGKNVWPTLLYSHDTAMVEFRLCFQQFQEQNWSQRHVSVPLLQTRGIYNNATFPVPWTSYGSGTSGRVATLKESRRASTDLALLRIMALTGDATTQLDERRD